MKMLESVKVISGLVISVHLLAIKPPSHPAAIFKNKEIKK
jgi:hypothetical protein